jgi:nitronate monooxygenase
MPWTETAATALLATRYPLVQAPMANITTPELVAAAAEAGALGSLGGASLSPDRLREQIRAVRERTDAPLNVNLFAPLPEADPGDSVERMQELLAPWRERLGLGAGEPPTAPPFGFDDQLEILLEEKPEVFSFTFGIPSAQALGAVRDAGCKVLGTATTVEEARRLESAGCDAIVAQGSEAGGHRGTFAGPFEEAMIGTMALVPQVVDAVSCPVIAAGGIMDGRGIAAALALGADAAQLGTAFLACEESAAPPSYRDSLEGVSETDTTVTRAFTGRPMRGLRTRFVEEVETSGVEIPPFPIQGALVAELRKAGIERGELDPVGRLVGQGIPMVRRGGAAEIVEELLKETEAALRSLGAP